MNLALLAHILLVGSQPAAPDLAAQLERAFVGAGQRVTVQSVPSANAYSGPLPEHVILAPAAPDLALVLADAQALPQAKLWLLEGWPSGPVTAAWSQQIDASEAGWADLAQKLGREVEVIPAGRALARLAQKRGPQELGGEKSPDDRAHYQAVVMMGTALGLNPQAIPERLVRAWMRRDSVVRTPLATDAREIAESLWLEARRPAPVESAAVPQLTSVQRPGIGFSLAPFSDWSVQQPFLDLMKSARPWVGNRQGQWGALSFESLMEGGFLDEAGWPRSIPPGVELVSLVLTDLPATAGGLAGRYIVSWEGKGDLRLGGRAQNVQPVPEGLSFTYQPGEGGVMLALSQTDPANPLRNIRILRADRVGAFEAGQIFNPDWLARLRGTQVVRFMDWMQANETRIATADERPKPADFSYVWRGAPIEIMVALANELGAEPWFNMPWRGLPDLNQAYALHVKKALKPELKVWIEYSNEAWNMMFQQAQGLEQEARERWGREWAWMQLYGLRAAEMVRAWDGVFGEKNPRLRRVLSSQTGWMGLESDLIAAPLVVAEGLPKPVTFFDAWAVTGYVSAGVGPPEHLALLESWLATGIKAAQAEAARQGLSGAAMEAWVQANRFNATLPLALQDLRDGRHSGEKTSSLEGLLGTQLPYHAQIARENGLDLVMYEGGTHAVAHGPGADNPEITAFLEVLNYSDGMASLYRDLLAGWQALTPQPFMAYVDVMAHSRHGAWGALRHLFDENPRWRALTSAAE